MRVAIVILNWNGKKLLEQFLPSVMAYSQDAVVYIADNASDDDSVSYLQEHFPKARIIRNPGNEGFAKGYNLALKQVEEEIVVLLNNDVEVTENWLTPVLDVFRTRADCVAAQSKILDYRRKDHFEYAGAGGGFIDSFAYPFCRGRIFSTLEEDHGQYNDTIEIFWATGAAFFVRKDAFMDAGGFDEDFFAHQEEIDLCWRLRKNGGSIYYCGNSTVYHLGGGTLSSINPRKTFLNFRNTLLLLYKHVEGPKAFRLIFIRLLLDGIAGITFLLKGKINHFFAILRAHFSFYSLLGRFRKKRKRWKNKMQYAKIKSVVWQYFIAKNRTFKELK